MKLELKQLASYLPYGLKVINIEMHENGFRTKHSVKKLVLTPSNLEIGLKDIDGIKEKPILRPISEINSKHHVKFRDNYYVDFDNLEGLMIKRINETYTRFNELNYLFENHFDVFGLIPAGLAVSINDVCQVVA